MIMPKVTPLSASEELWHFRGQYFRAFIFSDGVVQLRPCDKGGRTRSTYAVNSHNGHSRMDAIKWLNENVE